ncbi:hypothetical protein TNCV_4395501 [Trichonephila clavipes]|uniref:Integrase catalytic domain-containing protein n=1 Tax=Trichonephila clavipes TaxID=2585209 RepID=A0A8X7BDV2_TRICX|nr:hypothetical protein TNCV_4395501 [Trichonephila clavipes]
MDNSLPGLLNTICNNKKALPTAKVDEIAKFLLEEIVLRHGAPRVIITDRGAVFRSRLVSSLSSTCVTLIIVSQRRIIPKQMD